MPWLRGSVSRYIARFHQRTRVYACARAGGSQLALASTTPKCVGHGVDIDAFSPERRSQALRVAYGIDDAIVFLHVGRLAAEKASSESFVRSTGRVRRSPRAPPG